jgi:hypothetical protein
VVGCTTGLALSERNLRAGMREDSQRRERHQKRCQMALMRI